METVADFIFLGSKITVDCDCSYEIKSHLLLGRKAVINLDNIWKAETLFAVKIHIVKALAFPVVLYRYENRKTKKGWGPKNRCLQTVVLEKSLESPLDCKEIKSVSPKGNQPWIFIARTGAEAIAPILWPPDGKSWFIGKDPYTGKNWKQEEKWVTEDEMVGWHHWFNGHEFKQTLGNGEGQGSLVCYSPWGHKELDTTEGLNSNHKSF